MVYRQPAPLMNPIPIQIRNETSFDIHQQIAKVGVPLPKGVVHCANELSLSALTAIDPVYQIVELARWPDLSIRWVLVECLVSQKANSDTSVLLHASADSRKGKRPYVIHYEDRESCSLDDNIHREQEAELSSVTRGIMLMESADQLLVDTGIAKFTFSKRATCLFPSVEIGDQELIGADDWTMLLREAHEFDAEMVRLEPLSIECQGVHRVSVKQSGCYRLADSGKELHASYRFSLFANSALVSLDATLHNPAAAKHPGGFWDLGDEGSALFSEFSLNLQRSSNSLALLRTEPGDQYCEVPPEGERLLQGSSGGENWNSPAHIDATGQLTTPFPGYQQYRQAKLERTGKRASPTLKIENEHGGFILCPAKFWHNFPKSLEVSANDVTVGLFPAASGSTHELQGGERKTHTLLFDFCCKPMALDWVHCPLQMYVQESVFQESNTFAYMKGQLADDDYDALVNEGLNPYSGFIAKREVVDEYGWRHFGDLYADHETWNYHGADLLVSHYNNQYDPIYGFARQYCLSGNTKWLELLQDLAQHVMDIDIYRTTKDREEYNNGLFWHTDHYVHAYTASHRTFSTLQFGDDSEMKNGGGGPGTEHCYTTGLSYYYCMTGDTEAKKTVLQMAEWITRLHEGSGTFLDFLLKLMKQDLPDLLGLLKGEFRFRYAHPLTRGTGNYICALLDSHELTLEESYLGKAEEVIHNTIGPSDDIDMRELDNVEEHWSYTVFIQSLIKYLSIKVGRKEFDSKFVYARNSLLHYARWMMENEQPYLDKPEALGFVNDTWAAQDIRKSCILIAADQYKQDEDVDFLTGAHLFRQHVIERLSNSPEASYTRILAILMQNHGPSSILKNPPKTNRGAYPEEPNTGLVTATIDCQLTKRQVLTRSARACWSALRQLSPANELAWLRQRLF